MPKTPTPNLPTGTVTFLFTDIEGSTRLLQSVGDDYPEVLEVHNELLRSAIEEHNGIEISTEGDAFFAVFDSARDAVLAAAAAQRSLGIHQWPGGIEVRVRMGLHTGIGTLGGDDYVGLDVHRAARIAAAAHGGQTVMSAATATLVKRDLLDELTLRHLGRHRLKDLSDPEAIYQLVVAGLSNEFPPLRTLDAVQNNLPFQLTSFVGRDRELREATRLLEETSVLTLVGPGGTGKTRLALQVAAAVADGYPHGAHFVDLSPVSDPEFLPAAILNAIGSQAPAKTSPTEWLLTLLTDRQLLLVLDNFEQLLPAALLVGKMAHSSPQSKFLITSRSPLHIRGEQQMPVPPLGVPSDGSSDPTELVEVEGIRLFVERALAASPDFDLTDANAGAIAELVTRLDGLPLAIELVASQVKLLPVGAILDRLDLHTLGYGPSDVPARQQTIWNAIDWSYELLNDPARRLFERISVFAGGARLDLIEEVCGPAKGLGANVLETLATLIDHSLVQRTDDDGQPRFRLLHVISEYAADRLHRGAEEDEIRRRHSEAFADLAERAAAGLHGDDRRRCLDELDADHDNIRAALRWAIDSRNTNLAMRIVWAGWRFWQARGFLHEALRHVDMVLEMPGGDPYRRAKTLEARGGIDWWRGDMLSCIESYRPALEIQRELGDPGEIANALYNLALGMSYAEEPVDQAIQLLDEAEDQYESIGSTGGLADVYWGRGNLVAYGRGEEAAGREFFGRAIELYREAGDRFGLGWALFEYGDTSRRLGDIEAARRNLKEGLELLHGHGDVSAVVLFLASLAGLARDTGNLERAARLAGVVNTLRLSTGADIVIHAATQARELIDDLRGNGPALTEAFEQGATMDLSEAVAYALADH
jgi:predicted ATPase/class 3 adenylate cyclase